MSQQYDNTNRGVLFDNDRKETDKHPDMSGSLNVNGVEHWFSGWWKNSPSKGDFLSLSLGKPKDNQPQQQRQPQGRPEPERRGNRPSNANGNRPPPQRRPPPPEYDEMDDPYR